MVLQSQCQKIGDLSKREKALFCFPQQHFSDLKRAAEVPIDMLSAGTQKIPGGEFPGRSNISRVMILIKLFVCILCDS